MREKISKICLSIGIIVIIISLFMINYIQYTNAKLVGCFIYFGFMMEIIAIILKQQTLSKRNMLIMGICMILILMIGYAVYHVALMV